MSAAETGNLQTFSREQANEIMARSLGNAIRASRSSSEKLERITGIPERRIEGLRSHTEQVPVYLEDVLSLAAALGQRDGARFISGLIADLDLFAAPYGEKSPEKIGREIIALAKQLTGETE